MMNLIALLRKAHGYTLADVEHRTGVITSDVNRLEHGRYGLRISKLIPIARLFGVSADSLVRDRIEEKDWETEGGSTAIEENYTANDDDPWITAVEFYRCKMKLSKGQMAQFTGMQYATLDRFYSVNDFFTLAIRHFITISDALGVSVDDLLTMHRASEVEGNSFARPSRTGNVDNCIYRYRMAKSLRLVDLGKRLGGFSKQWALCVCAADVPPADCIRTLADYEGLTVADFLELYGPQHTEGAA